MYLYRNKTLDDLRELCCLEKFQRLRGWHCWGLEYLNYKWFQTTGRCNNRVQFQMEMECWNHRNLVNNSALLMVVLMLLQAKKGIWFETAVAESFFRTIPFENFFGCIIKTTSSLIFFLDYPIKSLWNSSHPQSTFSISHPWTPKILSFYHAVYPIYLHNFLPFFTPFLLMKLKPLSNSCFIIKTSPSKI